MESSSSPEGRRSGHRCAGKWEAESASRLRPEGGEQIVDAASMAPRADGEAATERDPIARSVGGLVEEPTTTCQPTARAHLAHHRVPHGRRVRPFEVQLLHYCCACAEWAASRPKIFDQDRAVPRADGRAVGTRRGMRRWALAEG